MKKRILSIITCLALCLSLLPTAAFAAEDSTVWVGGVELTDGQYLASGKGAVATTEKPSDGYAYYKDGVLTLSNYENKSAAYTYDASTGLTAAIYSETNLTILAEGTSRLNNNSGNHGIVLNAEGAALTICGGDTVNIVTANGYGIYTDGGDIAITSGIVGISSYSNSAIYAKGGDVAISGGTVLVDGDATNSGTKGIYGIYADNIAISGGKVTSRATDCAIYAETKLTVDEGLLITQSGGSATYYIDESGKKIVDESGSNAKRVYIVSRYQTIYVGGVELTDGQYLASGADAPTADKPSGGYAYYKGGVLTLSGYTYSGAGYKDSAAQYTAAVYSNAVLKIVLEGASSLTNTASGNNICGIYAHNGAISISGGGTLGIIADNGYGIRANNGAVTISGGTVNIVESQNGIRAANTVTISGENTAVDITADWYGISGNGGIAISGGTVTIVAKGERAIYSTNVAISGQNTVVDITASKYGIYADNTVAISGGTVTIVAKGERAINSTNVDISGQNTVVDITASKYGIFTSSSGGGITIADEDAIILLPMGGKIGNYTGSIGTILDTNGNPAPRVLIVSKCEHEFGESYETNDTHHWRLCSKNCIFNNYPEALGGASYGEHAADATTGSCVCSYNPITSVTVSADNTAWDYAPDAIVTLSAIVESADLGDVTYTWTQNGNELSYESRSTLTFRGLGAGTHTYTCTVTTADGYKKVATIQVTVGELASGLETAPKGATGLTYAGKSQFLLADSGSATGGTMQYAVGDSAPADDSGWSTNSPARTFAGEYTVWYRVKGDANYKNTTPASLTVTIAKATPTIAWGESNKTSSYYNGSPLSGNVFDYPIVTLEEGDPPYDTRKISYAYRLQGETAFIDGLPTAAGIYEIKAAIPESNDYTAAETDSYLTFTIQKATVNTGSWAWNTDFFYYDGEEKTVVLTGLTDGVLVTYIDNTETYAGDYIARAHFTLDTETGKNYKLPNSEVQWPWTILAVDQTPTIDGTADLRAGGSLDLSTLVSGAMGDVSFTISGTPAGVSLSGTILTVDASVTDAATYTINVNITEEDVNGDGTPEYKAYTGSDAITVTIIPLDIPTLTAEDITVGYTGSPVPDSAITGTATVNGTAVEGSWSFQDDAPTNVSDSDTYVVVFTPTDSTAYASSSTSITVTIASRVVTSPVIEGINAQYLHTGSVITPVPTAVKDGNTVIPSGEYTVTYESNVDEGTATLKIVDNEGGNYTVSGSTTFKIVVHEHDWKYNASGNTITATCNGNIGTCPVENKTVTIKLNALENLTYDGNAKIVTVTQSPADVFADIPAVTYGASGNVNAGKHTASLTYGEKTATLEFTIAAATPTVAWDNTTASVEYTGSAASITAPTVTLANGETFNGTISYSYTGTSSGSGLPTNAGTYEITASIDAQGNYNAATSTNKLTLTINKIASSCTAPAAVSGLSFNGGNQNLITAGTATGGTMQYSLDGSNWSETIPTGKDTKTYTVYYKVVGDGNHEDNAGGSVSVTIAKGAAPTVSIPVQQHVCTVATTGNGIDLASYLPADRGATTYGDPVVTGAFFKDGTAISDGVLTYGTNVANGAAEGSIAVTVTMANYESVTVTVPVKLTAKAIVTVTVPTAQNGTYNGRSHVGYTGQPSVADYAGDFEITYTGRNGTVYEATNAAPINAGDYTVTFKIPDGDLYMTGSGSVEFSVAKAVVTITADNKSAYRNDSVPELTCKVEGLVAGETLTTVPTVSTDADMTTTGTYVITVSGAEASDNYTITYVAGVLTVSKRPSSDSNPPAPSTEVQVPISGEDETIYVEAEVKGDKATIDHVDLNKLDKVIGDHVEEVGTITIDFSDLDSKKPITTVEIPSNVVKEIADAVNDPDNDAHSFEVILSDGLSIEFDAEALGEKAAQADGLDITISIQNSKDAKPNKKQEAALNGRPAYDIIVTSGGEHISDMGGKITIHAPYELQDGEHPRGIVVWYVDEDGKRERCETSYDPVKKRVNWKTDHLSLYMIGYDETLAKLPFTDVKEDDACFDAVAFMYENGLMVGVGDGTQFAPGMSLSRAMTARIFHALENEPKAFRTSSFNDVVRDFWYTDAIDWASANGVISGDGQGHFFPNQDVTREQLAVMLYQYAQSKDYDIDLGDKLAQPDASTVSFWAAEAVQWAVGNGILVENSVGYLAATDAATRADVAEAFMAFVNLYA